MRTQKKACQCGLTVFSKHDGPEGQCPNCDLPQESELPQGGKRDRTTYDERYDEEMANRAKRWPKSGTQ